MPLVIYDENNNIISSVTLASGNWSSEIDISQFKYIQLKRNTSLNGNALIHYIFTK